MTSDDGMTITETLSQAVARQAAEIERLRQENECLGAAMSSDGADACAALVVANAEIERLRGLLREWLDRPGIIEHPTWRKVFDERIREALGDE